MEGRSVLAEIYKQLKIMGEEVKAIIMSVMASDKGINKKVKKNTLVNSDIYNDIEYDVKDSELINILVNDYIDYIERGRSPGTYPPPLVIAKWCERKGLPTDNSTVFLICRSIYKKGIAPRPIFDGKNGVFDEVDKHIDSWTDEIFEIISEGFEKDFNKI